MNLSFTRSIYFSLALGVVGFSAANAAKVGSEYNTAAEFRTESISGCDAANKAADTLKVSLARGATLAQKLVIITAFKMPSTTHVAGQNIHAYAYKNAEATTAMTNIQTAFAAISTDLTKSATSETTDASNQIEAAFGNLLTQFNNFAVGLFPLNMAQGKSDALSAAYNAIVKAIPAAQQAVLAANKMAFDQKAAADKKSDKTQKDAAAAAKLADAQKQADKDNGGRFNGLLQAVGLKAVVKAADILAKGAVNSKSPAAKTPADLSAKSSSTASSAAVSDTENEESEEEDDKKDAPNAANKLDAELVTKAVTAAKEVYKNAKAAAEFLDTMKTLNKQAGKDAEYTEIAMELIAVTIQVCKSGWFSQAIGAVNDIKHVEDIKAATEILKTKMTKNTEFVEILENIIANLTKKAAKITADAAAVEINGGSGVTRYINRKQIMGLWQAAKDLKATKSWYYLYLK